MNETKKVLKYKVIRHELLTGRSEVLISTTDKKKSLARLKKAIYNEDFCRYHSTLAEQWEEE